jgi:Flp pilus assembly protein TadG
MSIVAPLMVLCMFGVIEMGRLFFAWATLQHAARTGTRVAVTGQGESNGTRLSLITTETQKVLDQLSGGGSTITVRSWPSATATGSGRVGNPGQPCELVEVEVRYTYRPVVPIISSLMPSLVLQTRDRKLNEPWTPCPAGL